MYIIYKYIMISNRKKTFELINNANDEANTETSDKCPVSQLIS